MELKLKRIFKGDTYTIGNLLIDGKYFCDTLEDTDRNLSSSMKLEDINNIKQKSITAIPTGRYKITLSVQSPKFSKYQFYKEVCDGKVPRLLNVPGFDGILLHVADGAKGAELVEGCIGIGQNKIKGGLLNGKETFKKLYNILISAKEDITISIL